MKSNQASFLIPTSARLCRQRGLAVSDVASTREGQWDPMSEHLIQGQMAICFTKKTPDDLKLLDLVFVII